MTVPYRKKLIEVALPLKAINEESARRKRKAPAGYPTTLHKWWAQRPLAACRAVLFSSLVDDPDSDPAFRKPNGKVDEERAAAKRADLFNLIESLVLWDNSNDKAILRSARAEIVRCVASRLIETGRLKADQKIAEAWTASDMARKCHARPKPLGLDKKSGQMQWHFDCDHLPPMSVLLAFLTKYAPPVMDPFCGGGSIPLEAQRLGLRAYASDLNPVPVLITKALIEIPPKFVGRPPVNPVWQRKSDEEKAATVWEGAQGLAADVRYYGKWMRDEAEKRIGHLYPNLTITKEMAKDRPDLKEYIGEQLTVIAWLWARTVVSPNPAFAGVHVPLVRAFLLSKQTWVEPIVDRKRKSFHFEVRTGSPTAEQKKHIAAGTKIGRGCKFRCLLSDEPIPEDHIKTAGVKNELGAGLLAVVAEGNRGRVYLSPALVPTITVARPKDLKGIDAPLANDPRNLWCLGYGLDTFDKLFTPRQLVALTTFSDLVQDAHRQVQVDAKKAGLSADDKALADGGVGANGYATAIAIYLAAVLSRAVDYNSSLSSWRPKDNAMRSTLAKQALPIVWDFAEANLFAPSSSGFLECANVVAKCVEFLPANPEAVVTQLDATAATLGNAHPLISTDPPYYDNIGYADLSDYFYVWLRRSLSRLFPSLFATVLTPKSQELIASPYRHKGGKVAAHEFFETGLGNAFAQMCIVHEPDYPLTVYYAFKQSESDDDDAVDDGSAADGTFSTGWETMLGGLIRAGFSIHGTWPARTEGDNRQVGIGTNSLASSIVLVCRPRPTDARLATRKEFLNALHKELPEALRDLQQSNIAPVDLAQASIGPGMSVFTRYAKVIESDGSPMTVRTALGIINQVLDEVLAEQEGDFDADTRWALAWFEQLGTAAGAFGDAETLSKAKNTAINGLVEAGIVKARAGKVQLVSRDELPCDWNPTADGGITVWEVTQHLIRSLQVDGEAAAAELLNRLGGLAETARELAYRLYSVCERKKWADEALAYNSLVTAWPELTKLALAERTKKPTAKQPEMFQ